MNLLPTISVVTITYGQENYIKQTLGGVLMQDYPGKIEFIIANDFSPDSTDDLVKDFLSSRQVSSNFTIKYTKHEVNKGMMPNFIWALEQTSGKYIALCEGDDYWTDPLKLWKQVEFLEKNPEYVLAFHPVKILKNDGSLVEDYITSVPEKYEFQETLASGNNYIHTPSVVFRNIIKSFPREFQSSPIGDYFLYIMLTGHGKMKMLTDHMAVYRSGVGVFSTQNNVKSIKSSLLLHSLLLSYSNNLALNQIFLMKLERAFDYLEKIVRKENSQPYAYRPIIMRMAKALGTPETLWRKIKSRL